MNEELRAAAERLRDNCGNWNYMEGSIVSRDARMVARAVLSAPAWHDRPTGEGLWIEIPRHGNRRFQWQTSTPEHWFGGRVYGPIPRDERTVTSE